MKQKVFELVSEHLGVDIEKITDDTSFINDLGADSLDIVELVMDLEEEFDVKIPEDIADKIQTVGDAVNFIAEESANN
ncbi:MAG: acyl carrier protein [Thermoguttaceae bacterium]|nr:acyl carrier protein [Thermoguttaceae bacterium]